MKTITNKIVCLTILTVGLLNAQVVQDWLVKYDGPSPSNDQAFDMVVDKEGNVYVTGVGVDQNVNDLDMITIKYASDGTEIWKTFYTASIIGQDQGNAIAIDSTGNVYVAGFTYQNPSSSDKDLLIVKYDQAGNQKWFDTYTSSSLQNLDEYATAIAIDKSGNIYVGGSVNEYGAQYAGTKFTVLKYDSSGNRQWVSNYFRYADGRGNDFLKDLVLDNQGNVYATGNADGFVTNARDYCTVKFNSSGDTIWARFYNGTSVPPAPITDEASAIEIDITGNIYVTGSSNGDQTGIDYATVKYSSSGDELWVSRYHSGFGDVYDDYATSLAVDDTGNVYVTGYSEQEGGTYNDYLTIKYDGNGNELWSRRYNGELNNHDNAYKIALDKEGGVYVSGFTTISDVEKDIGIIKYNSNGDSIWFTTQDPRNSLIEYPTGGLYVDMNKNIYVSATETISDVGNIMTIKFSENPTDVKQLKNFNPDEIFLAQNYPNPFNPSTKISWQSSVGSWQSLRVYDILGREIATLVDEYKPAGNYEITFNASDLPSGVYFYKLIAGSFVETKKMLLVR